MSRSRSEVVLVNAPSGDYVFCVITKDQADTSWEPNNAGYVLLRQVSAALWEHFEPGSSCNHGFASCAAEYIANALRANTD